MFGTVFREGTEVKNLKTVGDEHTNLKGFCHIERHYSDNVITDEFRVVEKYQTNETDVSCLDWYVIDSHMRTIDKFSPKQKEIESGITDSQEAICILSDDIETRLAEIEDALCEISAMTEEE